MLASIVVINYNYGRFLREAVESALAQSHEDTEVIVVDDGSTDDSHSVIASFGGGIRAVFQQNKGQGGALNAGYAIAKGDLIIFLDADDVLLPTAVAVAVSLAAEDRVVQVQWPVIEVDADGHPTGATLPEEPLSEGNILARLVSDGPGQWGTTPSCSANAWTRRYLETVMPVSEADFRMAAEAYLVMLAPLYGELRATREPHSHYRQHGKNHWGGSFDAILAKNLDLLARVIPLAATHAGRLKIEVHPDRWRERGWDYKLGRFLEALDSVVNRATPFVLIDGYELALDSTSGRAVIPFKERDGEYWGPPEDDNDAIAEFERLYRKGAQYLVLAWPSFWWAEEYPRFVEHMRRSYPCVLENDELVAFDLRR